MGRRIVVTGGSGFIGANLVDLLGRSGHEVFNLDIKPPATATGHARWRKVDICNRAALVSVLGDAAPEIVIHLAARTDLNGSSESDYRANTEGVRNVIEAAATASVKRVLFASSRLVCRIGYQPQSAIDFCATTPYGRSKVAGEELVRAAVEVPFEWIIVRPTSIWGPGFHIPYRNFFDAVRDGRYLHPRGVRVFKSFGYVGNTVHQLLQLTHAPADAVGGQMFYLADYEPIEVLDWGQRVRAAFGAGPIRQVPLSALRLAAGAGDGLAWLGWKNVPLTNFRLDNLVTEMLHDTTSLRDVCGALPFSLDEGVARTVAWMRADRQRVAA